jgi:transposase
MAFGEATATAVGRIRVPRFSSAPTVRGVFGDPKARVITLKRRAKNDLWLVRSSAPGLVRPTQATRSRFVVWRRAHPCGYRGRSSAVQELREGKARAARLPGGQSFLYQTLCLLRGAALSAGHRKDVIEELNLPWETIKTLELQYMRAQLAWVGTPGHKAIGIDEISIRKDHDYRIVVSDLIRDRPIWFGGADRKEASMALFYDWLGKKKTSGIRLAAVDMLPKL